MQLLAPLASNLRPAELRQPADLRPHHHHHHLRPGPGHPGPCRALGSVGFGSPDALGTFVRWRVALMERAMMQLDLAAAAEGEGGGGTAVVEQTMQVRAGPGQARPGQGHAC